jgi:phosphocarrier protein
VAAKTVAIVNELGLHARAAAKFVKLAATFNATIKVSKLGQGDHMGEIVSGNSILGLMMLGAGPGDRIEIATDGADADAALTALDELVSAGFYE